ncbi:30S ribosome-binding factor RbfA [Mycoplasmopsis opalescens]|uniref:30S ribosome-binding factor RbfA n=1 Tax=Mycoplasmopsis opalescens TaxID=114886 RepID=UPI0004A6FB08|nr:30S ribosome-binding factor RbfA [Mycoplasmopsis opalescens]
MNRSISLLRKEADIRNAVAYILEFELTNSSIINPTLVDCELSADLSHLKLYVTFSSKNEEGLQALKNASGFIRSRLANKLNWRKIPELHFFLDEVVDHGMKIDNIINNFDK